MVASLDGVLNQERMMYCSANWQLLEERIDDDVSGQLPNSERHMQYVWGHVGGRYIDDILLRRQNRDFGNDEPGAGGITYEDVWHHLTDTLFSTVATRSGPMLHFGAPLRDGGLVSQRNCFSRSRVPW